MASSPRHSSHTDTSPPPARTLSQFHGEQIYLSSFFHGVGIFLLTFFISMALGVVFGLSCSLMLKHSELGRYTEIEACLVLLIAYTSYFFSNALTMSGESGSRVGRARVRAMT